MRNTARSRAGLRRFRNLTLGLGALAAALLVLPGSAEAGSRSRDVSDRLDRIAYQVDQVRDIRSLRKRDRQIDRLQSRLDRLDRISDRHRGRRARINEQRIDRLQHRLDRMERRVEARLYRRYDRRYDGRRYDGRRYDGRYDRHRSYRGDHRDRWHDRYDRPFSFVWRY